MKAFGQAGVGYFPAPALLAKEICARYEVGCLGMTDEITECFWAISVERRINHPAIKVVVEAARISVACSAQLKISSTNEFSGAGELSLNTTNGS